MFFFKEKAEWAGERRAAARAAPRRSSLRCGVGLALSRAGRAVPRGRTELGWPQPAGGRGGPAVLCARSQLCSWDVLPRTEGAGG